MSDRFPSESAILQAVLRSGSGKSRDTAAVLGLEGDDKKRLKRVLRDLRDRGMIGKKGVFKKRGAPVASSAVKVGRPRTAALFRASADGGLLYPTDRRDGAALRVPREALPTGELPADGTCVAVSFGPRGVPIMGNTLPFGVRSPYAYTKITMYEYELNEHFPPEVEVEAAAAAFPTLHGREDLRGLPFIVIDPADARDRDDAVCAGNEDGALWLHVAVADVAFFVRPGTMIDMEARQRGNSVYFPDRAIPMLPERLSHELCSLLPGKDRAALVVSMEVNADGTVLRRRFRRALIRVQSAYSYESVTIEQLSPDLAEAHRRLSLERTQREPLNIESSEYRITLSPDGQSVTGITPTVALPTHRLIEDCMIAANRCVAEKLYADEHAVPQRLHPAPSAEKLKRLSASAERFDLSFTTDCNNPLRSDFNALQTAAMNGSAGPLIQDEILRTQMQASYAAEGLGHFGLGLQHYVHFTSPIRRYADLWVHRMLLRTMGLDDVPSADDLPELCQYLNLCERRASEAERACKARYTAAYYAEHPTGVLSGRVTGIAPSGAFVRFNDSGAEGLLPLFELPGFGYQDKKGGRLENGRLRLSIGDTIDVTIKHIFAAGGGIRLAPASRIGSAPVASPTKPSAETNKATNKTKQSPKKKPKKKSNAREKKRGDL